MKEQELYHKLSRLFKPLVKFCLRRGIRFQEITACIKTALIESAGEILEENGEGKNISRLSLLSGLQRREITTISNQAVPAGSGLNLLSRIVGQWQLHPDYAEKGHPRALECLGAKSEFASLVHSVSADVNPYTVLFALEQQGAVKKSDGKVTLLQKVYAPAEKENNAVDMLAQDVSLLFSAVEANISGAEKVPHLHITTLFDNLAVSEIDAIREWLLDKGSSLHEEARAYLAARDKDANPRLYKQVGGVKAGLCAFSFTMVPGENERRE